MDQSIAALLEPRTGDELTGAYRALCGMMLLHTAMCLRKTRIFRNEDAYQRKAARQWMRGEGGVITFSECCAALDLNEARAKQAILDFVDGGSTPPINIAHVENDNA